MGREHFEESALEAGFTDEQIDFLWSFLAHRPHTHTLDEIHDDEGETLDSLLG